MVPMPYPDLIRARLGMGGGGQDMLSDALEPDGVREKRSRGVIPMPRLADLIREVEAKHRASRPSRRGGGARAVIR